jgi:16S rRNA (cytidine1402-2'-O)-methyltransferase
MSLKSAGKLYVVSTPIGNIDDITKRAIDTLSSVSAVACEDTRHTGMLLSRLGIKNKLYSYNDINEKSRATFLLNILIDGGDIAIVSDAGTPGISDPAYRLIKEAVTNDIEIIPIPGASAVLSSLVVSGFPLDSFVFLGFLPQKGEKRKKSILYLRYESKTVIIYESPHRIINLLESMYEILGDREVSVSRELTKMFEETVRGKLSEVLEKLKNSSPRGEYSVVLRGVDD